MHASAQMQYKYNRDICSYRASNANGQKALWVYARRRKFACMKDIRVA
jgi:hypothetical protein